jgi:hypothetical protein
MPGTGVASGGSGGSSDAGYILGAAILAVAAFTVARLRRVR